MTNLLQIFTRSELVVTFCLLFSPEWLAQNGTEGGDETPRTRVKQSDSDFIKMCKGGGHKGMETRSYEFTK